MREDTIRCLKEYGVKTFGNKKNIEALDERIKSDEEVYYISFANMTVIKNFQKSIMVGAIAVTDKHLYILNAMGSMNEGLYPLSDISDIQFTANGLSGATFSILICDMTLIFNTSYKKPLARKLYDDMIKLSKLERPENSLPTA